MERGGNTGFREPNTPVNEAHDYVCVWAIAEILTLYIKANELSTLSTVYTLQSLNTNYMLKIVVSNLTFSLF